MAKMNSKAAPVSSYIGKSAVGADPKAGKLMDGSKKTASTTSGDGPPKPSTTKHGSGFIADAKAGK